MNLFSLVLASIFESKLSNAGRSLFRHDLEALDDAGDHLVLQTGIESLGVFANDDQVDIRIARGNVRQIANRTEVGVELELLSQGDVDAGKAAADRRSHWPLQSDFCAFKRRDQIFWNVFTGFLIGLCSDGERFPVKLHTRCFQNAHNCVSDLGTDAVARNESNFVTHEFRFLWKDKLCDRERRTNEACQW